MIIYDSCYSICNDIITNLGGTNKKWDSVYSQALYIAGLVGVDTPAKKYDSVYSILLDVIPALGGTNKLWDSVYSELKYIAELSGVEDENFDSSYSILTDIVGGSPSPCEKDLNIQFAVITDISSYTDRIYSKVFAKDVNKWYMLNNLNEYELYGVYADTFETTTYDGKLIIVDGKEYEYKNGGWEFLGNSTYQYDGAQFDGASSFDTGFKIANNIKAECEFISNNSSTNQTIFGNRTSSTSNNFICFDNGGKLRTDFSNKLITATTSVDTEALYKVEMYATTDGGNTGYYNIWKDGVFLTGGTISINAFSSTARNIYVGNNQDFASYNKGIIKYLKLYNNVDKDGNGTLAHSYIFKDVDGVGKMYDEITGEYLNNRGTGNITILQTGDIPKHYQSIDAPQRTITAATYCDLYKYDNSKLYIGQFGDVEDDDLTYIINSNRRWEERVRPEFDYDGLTFTALEDGAIAINHFGTNSTTTMPNLQYTFDGEEWINWDGSEITLIEGDKIGFRSTKLSTSTLNYSNFVMTGRIAASGNIMSLVDNGACTATTIPANYYFCRLFKNCSTLETAPDLTATTLISNCYYEIFTGCNNLIYIKALFTTTPSSTYTNNWVNGVAPTGVFVKNTLATWNVSGVNGVPTGWKIKYAGQSVIVYSSFERNNNPNPFTKEIQIRSEFEDYDIECPDWVYVEKVNNGVLNVYVLGNRSTTERNGVIKITLPDKYVEIPVLQGAFVETTEINNLYIQSLEDFNVVNFIHTGATSQQYINLYASIDGTNWDLWKTRIDVINSEKALMLNTNEKIYFKCDTYLPYSQSSTEAYNKFDISKSFNIGGDLYNSLYNSTQYTYMYGRLFINLKVVDASNLILPDEIYAANYYNQMFRNCTMLVNPPKLPAILLLGGTYERMFYGCTSLVEAPSIGEVEYNTASSQFYEMFYNCSNLNWVEMLSLTFSTSRTGNWLYGVAKTGVFVKNINATWSVKAGTNAIPSGWKTIYKDTTDNTYWLEQTKTTQCDKYGNPI